MPAPTLTSQVSSTWTDTLNGAETTGSLSWNSGDRILVMGVTEDAASTLALPTATGLTFAALGSALAAGSNCWVHCWEATAGSTSSSVVTANNGEANSAMRGIWVSAWGSCTGFLRTNGTQGVTTQTVSVTRTGANSGIGFIGGDWSAGGVAGIGWTPAGQTQIQAVAHANMTGVCAYWGDQGAAGTTSYGTSGLASRKWSQIAVEILGSTATPVYAGPWTSPTPGRRGPTGRLTPQWRDLTALSVAMPVEAAGTGVAFDAAVDIQPAAGVASATAVAFDATVTITGNIVGRTATVVETASGTSVTGTLPSDLVTGDLVVASFHMSSTVVGFTPPSGWTQFVAPTSNGVGSIVAAYYRFDPPGGPQGTASGTGRQTVICQAYGGVDTATPIDVAATISTSGTSPLTVTQVTTVTNVARLLSGATIDASTGSWTTPPGMTSVKTHTSGVGRGGALADEIDATAGATGTRQWAFSVSQAMVGYLTALRPTTTTVNAETTTGAGTAFDAQVDIAAAADTTTGTGTALDAAPDIDPAGGTTTGTGAASDAAPDLGVSAETTTATGTAYDATVSTTTTTEQLYAGPWTGPTPGWQSPTGQLSVLFGDAQVAQALQVAVPAEAAGTGTAFDASVAIGPAPETTTAAGTAFDASPDTAVNAETTTGTGSASDAGIDNAQPTAGPWLGPTPGRLGPTGRWTVTPTGAPVPELLSQAETTTGAGTAFDASVAVGVAAETTTATGDAAGQSVDVAAAAALASATGAALDVVLALAVAVEQALAVGVAISATSTGAVVATNATSDPAVTAGRTSTAAVTARRTSSPAVTGRASSTPTVSEG